MRRSGRMWPAVATWPAIARARSSRRGKGRDPGISPDHCLVGADDLEVLDDEDVVRPVDADVVDLVLAVAQLHNTVDDASRVGGQRSFSRFIRCRSADDRTRPLTVVRWDLTDLL